MTPHEIKSRRQHLGMTQAELAARTMLNVNRIASFETGRQTPSIEQERALHSVLGNWHVTVGQRSWLILADTPQQALQGAMRLHAHEIRISEEVFFEVRQWQ